MFTGDVQIDLTNAQGQGILTDIQDNRDGTFTVEYLTPSPGDHRMKVLFAGSEIPQSPIVVPVQPNVDVTKVKVDGLEPSKCSLSFVVLVNFNFFYYMTGGHIRSLHVALYLPLIRFLSPV